MFKIGEAQIRLSEITECFYCETSLPATKKEHIFNSCWGGSHSTTKLICDNCNSFFSQSVDSSLSVYVNFVMNAWSFKGERHKRIPEIETEDGFVIGKYGKPRYKEPQITTETQSDGTEVKTGISFNSKDEAYKFLKDKQFEAHFGRSLTPNEQQLLRQAIKEAKVEEFAMDDPIKFSVSVDLQKQYRSAAHTLLKCMGMYAPEWVKENETKRIRDFIRHDVGDWTSFAVDVQQLLPSVVEMTSSNPFHNTVEIYWCRSLGQVVGVLTLLGRIRRSLVLVDKYQGETSGMLHLVEDVYGSKKPPKSIFMEVEHSLAIFPFLETRNLSPSDELFSREVSELIWRGLSIDGPTGSLLDGIAKNAKEIPEINESFFQRYEELFTHFAFNMVRAADVSSKPTGIRSKLDEYGFSELAEFHMGKSIEDKEVRAILLKVIKGMYRELIQPLFSKFDTK